MKRKRLIAVLLTAVMVLGMTAGCGKSGESESGTNADGEKVNLKLFTGKIETIDVMDEIIDDFNNSQDRIVVEQEYQKDASNVIKIKFASDEVPDIMTVYEQGFVDEGKYMDLSDQSEWWDRMSPEMKEACTDVKQDKAFRVCTNRTTAGFFYNKEIFEELGIREFPTQWGDFVEMLEKIKTEKPDIVPWFIFGSEAWHLGHLIEFIPHGYIKSTLGTLEAKKSMLDKVGGQAVLGRQIGNSTPRRRK